MSEITHLKLPESTPFPVKILSLDLQKNDTIKKHQQILRYSYWEFQDEPESPEEEKEREAAFRPRKKIRVDLVGSFESPFDGLVQDVLIAKGDEVISSSQTIAHVLEPCSHSIQYSGLCALCGKSLDDEVDYSGYKYEDRAPISMSHGTSNLKISKDEAEKVEEKWTESLINDKKMILVVDLDQTVIHATVDPTIGEWMHDETNPNYPSLKDVQTFSLEEDPIPPPHYQGPKLPPNTRWYYVKSRPGLTKFLEDISEKYELHIYTMGTRAYAKKIAQCIDPEGKFFADRILSRDESGSMTQKSLERLFPTDTSMVVIIDDRGDVWNWSEHLIKVVPFDFFVGIGDINSNFLPRQRSLLGPTKRRGSLAKLQEQLSSADPPVSDKNKLLEDLESKIEEIDDQEDTKQLSEDLTAELEAARSSERELSLEAQEEERPLSKLQDDLELLAEEKGAERLLYDDDDELIGLREALLKIHEKFYEVYERDQVVPDVKYLLPELKQKVFEGLEFVFSGLFPLGSNINNESIVIWAKSFGATIKTDITLQTTHVITKHRFTYKARLAKSMLPNVNIVHPNWLFNSLTNWRRSEEEEYRLQMDDVKVLPEQEVEAYKRGLEEKEGKENGGLNGAGTKETEEGNEDENLLGGDMNWLDMDEEEEDFTDSEAEALESTRDEDDESETSKKRSAEEDDGSEDDDESLKRRKIGEEKEEEIDDEDEDELAAELMLGLDDDDDDDDDNNE